MVPELVEGPSPAASGAWHPFLPTIDSARILHNQPGGTPAVLSVMFAGGMPWVYILRCRDGSYYVGSTAKDPEMRLWEHNNDESLAARHTIKRRPVSLAYVEEFAGIDDAFRRERQVHGWSRAKKQALIDGRGEDLPSLSRARKASPAESGNSDASVG